MTRPAFTHTALTHATLVFVAVLLAAAGPAPVPPVPSSYTGPDRPAIPPTRDAVLGYRLQPGAGESIRARVSLQAGAKMLRLDLPDLTYMLATPATHSLVMVVPLERTTVDLPWSDGPQMLFLLDDAARYTRKGDSTVAGQRCTVFDVQQEARQATVCVSPEGLVLRHQSTDDTGRRNLVEAYAVQLGGTTDAEFKLPAGFERLQPSLPPLLPGPR